MRGFSLIELIVVIVLAAILAVGMFARAPSKGALTINGQAEQLAADLRYAQTLVQTQGQRICIDFTASGYRLTTAASSCATDVETASGLTGLISLDGITLTNNLPSNRLVFGDKGVPYTDTTGTALSTTAQLTLSGEGGSIIVYVSPVTGRVCVPIGGATC
jgi:prepilin-type N-terminal cleavage/methylation domain-containing protein